MSIGGKRIINAVAPVRICDNGGWTDTWFAKHGKVFNIAVLPCVEVQAEILEQQPEVGRIIINAENHGERIALDSDEGRSKFPFAAAAIERMHVPANLPLTVSIYSEVPSGASTGTSAAVAVALVGAFDCLTHGKMTAHQIAYTAHSIEMEMLKRQSGIQDQLCSAYGGINFIEMYEYPHSTISQLEIPEPLSWELEKRLLLVYLGKGHDSSAVHAKVVGDLERKGPNVKVLNELRAFAEKSRDALAAGDLTALGRAMIGNTEAQRELHPSLISKEAEYVFAVAGSYGALGWKVNGAGGEGGSVTILCNGNSSAKRAFVRDIESTQSAFKNIPISLSRQGLRVWEGT